MTPLDVLWLFLILSSLQPALAQRLLMLRRAQALRRHIGWASAVLLWLAGAYIVYYWLTAIRLA